ncbi:putative amidase, partial [Mytilinidion resinicola]
PVVVISVLAGLSSVAQILESIKRFAAVDDVFSKSFATTLVLKSDPTFNNADLSAKLRSSALLSAVYYSHPKSHVEVLPSGPYFLYGGGIHQAWRLYEDELDSFIFSVVPDDVLKPKRQVLRYTVLESFGSSGTWRNIAEPSQEKPLAGARMGVKDIFRLEGVKLTMMSRPWIELYGPDEESADYVKKLISLGAVIVGKTKMASFASPEEPTDQWIDFHCPVNPRRDRYQRPSSSSTGAGVALAGYPWLDYSIGGDSAGSVRAPAPCSGLFSLRLSFNSTSMRGIPANLSKFDVVGQLSRDLDDLHHTVAHTFDLNDNSTQFPSKILYAQEFYPLVNEKQQAMTEEFISILEGFLGVKRTLFSMTETWDRSPLKEAEGKSLLEYLEKTDVRRSILTGCHMASTNSATITKKFGKEAYVGPVVRFRWNVGKGISRDEYETYLDHLAVFRNWFGQHLMSHDPQTLSNAILIMSYGMPDPEYRDEPNLPAGTFISLRKNSSPVFHAPQLVLPFAQMPYHSKISGRDEVRPIASTMIGAKGTDLMLIKLTKAAFKKASWPITINIGRLMYPLADNLRNVAPSSENSANTYAAVRQAVNAVKELETPLMELSTEEVGRSCVVV